MTQISSNRIESSIRKVNEVAFNAAVSLFLTVAFIPILIWWIIDEGGITKVDGHVVVMSMFLIVIGFVIIAMRLDDLRRVCFLAALEIEDEVCMNEAFFLAEEDPSYSWETHQKWLRKAKRLRRIAKWLE